MLPRKEALKLDLDKINKIHLIGITSPFNSFCATKLLKMGKEVTASQHKQDNEVSKKWIKKGVLYPGGHDEEYITKDLDLVIFPNVPYPGNLECQKAEELGLDIMTIGQLTGLLSKDYKTIPIAGTHGKTTTTSLITWALSQLDVEPNFLNGDKILGLDKSWNENEQSDYLVVEACEYKRQFLDRAPKPYLSVVTHIGLDHVDYFKSQEDYNNAFVEFLNNTEKGVIIDAVQKNEQKVIRQLESDIKIYDVDKFRDKVGFIESTLRGEFNQENLIRAYIASLKLGFAEKDIRKALKSFPGVAKRFEYAGRTATGSKVFKDYAHNPEKIAACLQSAKDEQKRNKNTKDKVILVWQPHNYRRTHDFKEDYVESIKEADYVLIPNIFSRRGEVVGEDLVSTVSFVEYLSQNQSNTRVFYTENFLKTIQKVKEIEQDDDCLVVLASAGDLHEMACGLVNCE
jgi:UDP-N-acetylmuramate--alanine ligase